MSAGAARAHAVLVTRPGDAGRQLADGLRNAGTEALWWPAFDLLGPAQPERLRELGRRLERFDLAVFVSPAAVRGWAGLGLSADWPAATAIAAVGASSLELARRSLPGVEQARCIAPADAATAGTSGSEALWPLLSALRPPPRRVLIVRAETGREWLAQQLRQAGAEVEYASVYRRVEHQPDGGQRAGLQDWADRGLEPACLVTSSEAVGALDRQLSQRPDLRQWLRAGLALCTHERIGKSLCEAGYRRVARCEPTVESVRSAVAQRQAVVEALR